MHVLRFVNQEINGLRNEFRTGDFE
jgi:hypothetical protein